MQTPDLVLGICVPLVTGLAGFVGIELSLTPADRLSRERRIMFRVALITSIIAAIALSVWQTARSSDQQEEAQEVFQKRETALTNKVSEQGTKLDFIARLQQQFLVSMPQQHGGASANNPSKAYEAIAAAVLKMAQPSSPTPSEESGPPTAGRLSAMGNKAFKRYASSVASDLRQFDAELLASYPERPSIDTDDPKEYNARMFERRQEDERRNQQYKNAFTIRFSFLPMLRDVLLTRIKTPPTDRNGTMVLKGELSSGVMASQGADYLDKLVAQIPDN